MADPTTDPFENIRLPGKTVTGRRAPRPDGGRILPLPNPGFPSIGAKPVSERTRRAVEAGPVTRRRGFDTTDLRDTSSLRTSDLRKADSRPLGSFKPIDTEGADGRSWSQWSDQWQLELGMIDPKEYDRRHGSEYETNRIPVASADDSKTHGERISDAASDAWNHTGLPATLARTAYSRLPAFDPTGTMSREERVAQQGRDVAGDERDYRELRDTRRELDPAGGFAKFIDEAAGGTIGGVDPTYLIGGPAKNVLGRMAVQGGVNAGVDALSQGLDISSGVQDEYDPWRTAAAGVGGAAFEGVATAARHGAGAVRDRFFPSEGRTPTLADPIPDVEFAPRERDRIDVRQPRQEVDSPATRMDTSPRQRPDLPPGEAEIEAHIRGLTDNPDAMYHGSPNGNIEEFDPYGKGGYGLFGTGTYLTDSPSIAASYTKKGIKRTVDPDKTVYAVEHSVKNPLDMDKTADPAEWGDVGRKVFDDEDFFSDMPEGATNEAYWRDVEEHLQQEGYYASDGAETMDSVVRSMGKDGITHMGGGRVNADGRRHRVVIALDPEQTRITGRAALKDVPGSPARQPDWIDANSGEFDRAEAHSPTLEEPVAHQEAPQETPSPEVPASIAAERVKRQPVAQDRSDRIDQLDDLYADPRATPEQKDAYAEEQDRLMAEESAERYAAQEKARPQNDDTPESLHDRVVRHEHDYNQMAFGADDDRRFARRNTRAYKEYHAELSQLEEKYRNSAKELIGAMPIEELRSIAGPIEHSGGPWADEVFNELRNRAELPDEVRDVADGILKEQWEKPTLKQERIGDATKSIDEESARLEEEAAFAKKQERTPAEDVVERLTMALKNAEKARGDQNKLYAEERSRRFAKARAIREKTGGDEASLKAELAALGGELPRADFESVRDQFSEDDLRILFQHLANHPGLDNNMEPLKARVALKKLLDGERPGDAELELLRKVFPKDFIAAALKHRGAGAKIMDVSNNLVNLSFSMMSSADLSAPMRQGVFLIGRKEFWKAWPEMFKQFALGFRKSDEAFDTFMKDLKERPNYELAEQYKLAISDAGQNVHAREERFQSPWAERIPIFGRLNKASGRAYTAFLNKVRMDTFDSFIKLADDAGMDFDEAGKFLKDATGFINAATGRGGLPPVLEKAAPLINGLLFSPRLMSSRLTLLNPLYYPKLHPIVRKEALKALVTFSGIAATVLTLAALSGADVERDSRSSDFGKIKVGNKRFDVLGGFGQYITLFSRIAPFLGGKTKTSSGEIKEIGKDFGSPTRLGVVGNFLRSKSSPIASLGMDYLAGSDVTGKPFQALPSVDKSGVTPGEVADRFMPMIIGDMTDLVKEDGPVGILEGVPGIFGISTQTYNANSPPHSFTVEGEKVTLSPSDYKTFADLSETYSKDMLEQLHDTEEFKEATPEEQIKLEKRTRTSARKYAKEDLLADPEADVNLTTKEPEEEGEEFTFGVPTSGRRTMTGNAKVGGIQNSWHPDGDAMDFIPSQGVSWDTLYKEAKKFFPGARVILEPAGVRNGVRHGKHVHVQQRGLNAPAIGAIGNQ